MEVAGLREALDLLKRLPDDVAARVVRPALTKACDVGAAVAKVDAAMRSPANRKGGGVPMFQTLVIRKGKSKSTGDVWESVGFAAPHAHLVELGHRIVVGGTVARIGKGAGRVTKSRSAKQGRTGAGSVVGTVPPHPILKPATDATMPTMKAVFVSEVTAAAERTIKRLAKKGIGVWNGVNG